MHGMELSPARRRPSLVLTSLTFFLLLLPLTLSKPGIPVSLKADEAAYYLASLSLWNDGDLVCDDGDARRLFQEFASSDNVLLMRGGSGQAVYFSVPIVYPLVAIPFAALFGANGMVMLNAVLLMAMVWMGVVYLRRHNDESLSILFAAGYFLLSTAFVYMFWLQAEVFNMACVMAAFWLIERGVDGAAPSARRRVSARRFRPRRLELRRPGQHRVEWHAAGSAAMLATACYSKPMLIALALPMVYLLVRPSGAGQRSWRGLAAYAISGLLTAIVLTGTGYALTDQVWPYFAPRTGVSLSGPVDFIERQVAPRLPQESAASPVGQITRSGEQLRVTIIAVLLDAIPEFLFGRHGGFFAYMPFAVLAILFFLLRDRRSVFRWLILASAALTAVLFVTLVRGQWLGGGGFVGNRYFITVYPSFLFLVRRLHPSWLTALGYGAAAIFLGPLLITPLGAMVSHPTLQAHVRNQPFHQLPLEWSLVRKLAGYRLVWQAGVTLHGRRDEIWDRNEEIWVHGAKRVEISLFNPSRDRGFVFDVRNLAPGNTIEICVQSDCQQLTFDEAPATGRRERVVFAPQPGDGVPRSAWGTDTYKHRLTITSEWGEQPRWRGSGNEHFYLGAALTLLGTPDDLASDLFHVDWLRVDTPPQMDAGSTVAVPIAIRNASSQTWPNAGAIRVRASYHWLSETGDTITRAGRRTELPAEVDAGREIEMEVLVDTPETPGQYLLALDLIRERVDWFSATDEQQVYQVTVEIVVPEVAPNELQDR